MSISGVSGFSAAALAQKMPGQPPAGQATTAAAADPTRQAAKPHHHHQGGGGPAPSAGSAPSQPAVNQSAGSDTVA